MKLRKRIGDLTKEERATICEIHLRKCKTCIFNECLIFDLKKDFDQIIEIDTNHRMLSIKFMHSPKYKRIIDCTIGELSGISLTKSQAGLTKFVWGLYQTIKIGD